MQKRTGIWRGRAAGRPWTGRHGAGRPARPGVTLVEVSVAIAIVVAILIPLGYSMTSSYRQLVRMEDLVRFQNTGTRILDAAGMRGFRFVEREAPTVPAAAGAPWKRFETDALKAQFPDSKAPGTIKLQSWAERDTRGDRLVLWVVVSWESPESQGRSIRYATRLGRVIVRPETTLGMEIGL